MNQSVSIRRTLAALSLVAATPACQVNEVNTARDAGIPVNTFATGGGRSQDTALGGAPNQGGNPALGGSSTNDSSSSQGTAATTTGGTVGTTQPNTGIASGGTSALIATSHAGGMTVSPASGGASVASTSIATGGATVATSNTNQGGGTGPTTTIVSTGGSSAATSGTALSLPPPSVGIVGDRKIWDAVSYVVPPDMTETVASDGVVMQAPRDSTRGSCFIAILAPRPVQADPDTQMLSILLEFFAANYSDLRDINGGTSPLNYRQFGISGRNWEYSLLLGSLVDLTGVPSGDHARIMLVNLDADVLPVIGFEASDNRCLDEAIGTTVDWQLLYYSLDFPNFVPANPDATLEQLLIGKWRISDGTYFLGETYAANGQYATQSAYQSYSTISATEIQQTTTTWLGDGAYVTHGDQLSTIPSNGKPAETHYYRIIVEPNSATTSGWLPRLYQLKLSTTGGNPYEYVLTADAT